MQTLYGLTEDQMWEIYDVCKLECWKQNIVTALSEEDKQIFTTDDILTITNIICNIEDMFVEDINQLEHEIILEGINRFKETKKRGE